MIPRRERDGWSVLARAATTAVAVGLASAVMAAGGAPQLDQTQLSLDVSLSYRTHTLRGTATLTVVNRGEGVAASVPLQLGRLMTVDRVHREGKGEVRFMTEHAPGELDRFFEEWFFTTRWLERLTAGETLAGIAAKYAGRPARSEEAGS